MGINSSKSGVIHIVAGRWQKVTRKGLETPAGLSAGSQSVGQNASCIHHGLFKVTSPSSMTVSPGRDCHCLTFSSHRVLVPQGGTAPVAPTRRFLYKTVVRLWPVLTKPPRPHLSFCCRKSWGCASDNVWKAPGKVGRPLPLLN